MKKFEKVEFEIIRFTGERVVAESTCSKCYSEAYCSCQGCYGSVGCHGVGCQIYCTGGVKESN